MEQLTRLKINKYRHIKPGTELRFNSGYNVLLGKNGTGKTTLLDLISIVISGDFSSMRGEEFALEYEFKLPLVSMSVKVRNVRVHREVEAHQPRSLQEMNWDVDAQISLSQEANQHHTKTYQVTINQQESCVQEEKLPGEVRRVHGSLFDGSFVVSYQILSCLSLVVGNSRQLRDANLSLFNCWLRTCRFDESLEVFELILGDASEKLRRQPRVVLAFYVPSHSSGEVDFYRGFYPMVLSEELKARLQANIELTACELTEKQVNFLAEFASLVGSSSSRLTLSLDQKIPEEERYEFKIREFIVEYPDGRYLTHEKLSYGQKRLLAFLYYLAANKKFVIADELTDSFHHEWIEKCMEKMAGRQCFLSSQNPILLDYLPISSEEEAKKTFIQCRLEPEGDKEWMVWRNLSDEDAHEFYEDLKTGVQYISEILMGRGLW